MLRSVEIQNFRSCVNTSFSLDTTLSALCGRNGVGKTNVLKAIEWACSTAVKVDQVWLPGSWRRRGSSVDQRVAWKFEIELDGETYRYRLELPPRSAIEDPRSAPPPNIPLESLGVGPDGSEKTIFHNSPDGIKVMARSEMIRVQGMVPGLAVLSSLLPEDDPAVPHLHRVKRFLGNVRYYPLEDFTEPEGLATELEYADWKFRHRVDGHLDSSLTMRLLHMHQEEPDLFNELKALLGPDGLDVVDDIHFSIHDALEVENGSTRESKSYHLYIKPSRRMSGPGGGFFSFGEVSDGTRRVIRIVTSMLFDRRSLMLMEQPEDSIHPGLLYKLVDLLRTYSGDTQVLFTTHSPAVLDMLGPEEILLTTAEEGATQVRRLTQDEMERAKDFLATEGALSEFLEAQDDL